MYAIKKIYKSILLLILVNHLIFSVWFWFSGFLSSLLYWQNFLPLQLLVLYEVYSIFVSYLLPNPLVFTLGSALQLPTRAAGLHLRAVVSDSRAGSLPFSGLHLHCATQCQPSKPNTVMLM